MLSFINLWNISGESWQWWGKSSLCSLFTILWECYWIQTGLLQYLPPHTHTQNYTTRTQTQNHTQDYMDLCSSSHFGNIFMFMAEVEAAGVKTFLVSVVRLQAHFALIKAQLEHWWLHIKCASILGKFSVVLSTFVTMSEDARHC